ncbi:MAG: hypothetical protein J6Q78_03495 [Clostridia bacterium]|nr:hypothetical protein [Clostridia bacterium]
MKTNMINDTRDIGRRYMDNDPCYASMTTLTNAMKAQRLLSLNAIPSNVIKNQDLDSKRGCAYRITFSCGQERNVRAIFEKEGVKVKGWNGQGI